MHTKKNIALCAVSICISLLAMEQEKELLPIRKETFSATAFQALEQLQTQALDVLKKHHSQKDDPLVQSLQTVCEKSFTQIVHNTDTLDIANQLLKEHVALEEGNPEHNPEGFLFAAFVDYVSNKRGVILKAECHTSPIKSFKLENIGEQVALFVSINSTKKWVLMETDLAAFLATYIFKHEQKESKPLRVLKADVKKVVKAFLGSK